MIGKHTLSAYRPLNFVGYQQSTCAISNQCFVCMQHHSYLKEQLTEKPATQTWACGGHLIQNDWSEPAASRETIYRSCNQWLNSDFQVKVQILENLYLPPWAYVSQDLNNISDVVTGENNECVFYII